MIEIRLPRLPQGYGSLQVWWQTVVEAIERAFANVSLAQATADGAQETAELAVASIPAPDRTGKVALDELRSLDSDARINALMTKISRLERRVENVELVQA